MVHERLICAGGRLDESRLRQGVSCIHVNPSQGQAVHCSDEQPRSFFVDWLHFYVPVNNRVEIRPAPGRLDAAAQTDVHFTGQYEVKRSKQALFAAFLRQLEEL